MIYASQPRGEVPSGFAPRQFNEIHFGLADGASSDDRRRADTAPLMSIVNGTVTSEGCCVLVGIAAAETA